MTVASNGSDIGAGTICATRFGRDSDSPCIISAFGKIASHASLGQHVLASPQRGHRQFAMQIRPRADADSVNLG